MELFCLFVLGVNAFAQCGCSSIVQLLSTRDATFVRLITCESEGLGSVRQPERWNLLSCVMVSSMKQSNPDISQTANRKTINQGPQIFKNCKKKEHV